MRALPLCSPSLGQRTWRWERGGQGRAYGELSVHMEQSNDRGAWTLWRLIPRLFPYLKPYKGLVVGSLFLSALAVLIGLADPWPLAFMVDNVLGNHAPPALVTQIIGPQDRCRLLLIAALAGLVLVVVRNA